MPFRYRNFKVYQEAIEFHRYTVRITKKFSKDFDYLLKQGRRCTLSVILNIAEGSAKNSDKDFNRYLNNSLGSINEAMAVYEVALKEKLINQQEFDQAEKMALNLTNQLGSFSKKLKQ